MRRRRTGTPSSSARGHNALVTAAYLAKAGLRTLVLERRERVGGAADTTELAPGIRVPTLAHTVGRLRPSVMRDLDLKAPRAVAGRAGRAGLRAVSPTARPITLWATSRTADGLRGRSRAATPTPIAASTARSARSARSSTSSATRRRRTSSARASATRWPGLKLGRTLPGPRQARRSDPPAGPADGRRRPRGRVLRDRRPAGGHRLAGRAVRAARALVGRHDGRPAGRWRRQRRRRGGRDGLRRGRAGRARRGARRGGAGGRRRDPDRGRGRRRHLASTAARPASSSHPARRSRPRRSSPAPTRSDPASTSSIRSRSGRRCAGGPATSATPGVVAKVNLALSGAARFPAAGDDERCCAGRIVVAPGIDAIERAFDAAEVRPLERDAHPRGDDPVARRPDARRGRSRPARRS